MTLTTSNPTGTDGFNLSYRVVLPAGVSYGGGPVTPTVVVDVPGVGQATLFFENVSDLLAESDVTLAFFVDHAVGSYPVGSSFAIEDWMPAGRGVPRLRWRRQLDDRERVSGQRTDQHSGDGELRPADNDRDR